MPVTGVVITFNEEDRIAAALASLSCCDEVIVVDSESTDRTREVAEALGARVIIRAWQGYSNQKNFAAAQAKHDWILSIDADERLTIELADEIAKWKKEGTPSIAAASFPRRAYYLGAWIRRSGWRPDTKIRLYDRRRAHWRENEVLHESLNVEGRIAEFKGNLLHFPYRSWADHCATVEHYTSLASQAARKSGRRGSVVKLFVAPPATFLKAFLLQGGFIDGWRGLAIAYMGARYVFLREFRILR